MDLNALKQILADVASGRLAVDKAAEDLSRMSYENIGYAHVDHHRSLRKGFPEVIFGAGKTPEQVCGIMERMCGQENVVLVTRVTPDTAARVTGAFPGAVYHADAKMVVWKKQEPANMGRGTIAVMCAGTSDIPVAREAFLTAQAMGNTVESVFDVGVAGIHRLFGYRDLIERATVIVVAAGMEGALPSVVAGMTGRPVIAVPTSIGYGASLGGFTALLGMLNSCSSNVAVVNIDNGFGAGYMAACINRK
ncbi:MAG: nickel pincer cofactor biosynthesis protein LarB [Thermodesulfobacteriota bacterium]